MPRNDSNKVYSVHAPEVECIAKGMVIPLTGHTLKNALQQVKQITGWQPLHAYCDRGYRGVAKEIPETEVHLSGKKKKSMKASLWKWHARRSAIEPIFGHLKSDHRLERNHLQGKDGDCINAILSGCGFNLRKLLRAFFLSIFRWLFGRHFDHATEFIGSNVSQTDSEMISARAF